MHIHRMELEFDPEQAAAYFRKHRVSFAHAKQALRVNNAITIEDPDAEGERRLVPPGMDALGRALVVIHTQSGERTRLISARRASPGETEHYHA